MQISFDPLDHNYDADPVAANVKRRRKMSCCDGNCRQGRDCPHRTKSPGKALLHTILIVVLLFLFLVVGRIDYDAAVVSAQILQQGASNGR